MQFRSNIKANVLSANQIIAFAYGFRANYPIENDRKIHRRDIYDSVEEMMNKWAHIQFQFSATENKQKHFYFQFFSQGIDGSACILKIFCEASKSITHQPGMFYKLFKLIFTWVLRSVSLASNVFSFHHNKCDFSYSLQRDDAAVFPLLTPNGCDEISPQCPMEMLNLSPYTDIWPKMKRNEPTNKYQNMWPFVIPFRGKCQTMYKLYQLYADALVSATITLDHPTNKKI